VPWNAHQHLAGSLPPSVKTVTTIQIEK